MTEALAIHGLAEYCGFSALSKFCVFYYLCAGRQFSAFKSATSQTPESLITPAINRKEEKLIILRKQRIHKLFLIEELQIINPLAHSNIFYWDFKSV